MIRNSLRVRLLAPVLSVILIVVIVAAAMLAIAAANRESMDAATLIERQSRGLQSLLGVTRSIMLERVQSSMKLLRERGEALGPARIGTTATVMGKQVPDLVFGKQPQANQFELVDGVTAIMGGTATLFSRGGDDFVRVSTNVKKDDGSRAIGTQLDPNGPVIVDIRQNTAFYGVVDILGNPYVTGYEPIRDESRNTIGIWYVGYKTDLEPLENVIGNSRVLESGFVALFDGKGKLRFHSRGVAGADEATIERVVKDQPADWTVVREDVPGWGFTLVSAYPKSEVNGVILRQTLWIGGVGLLLCLILFALQSGLIWTRVLQPIQHLTAVANELSLGKFNHTITETRLEDEIGTLAKAIARLSNSVRVAMDRLARK